MRAILVSSLGSGGRTIFHLIDYYHEKMNDVILICLDKDHSLDSELSKIPVHYLSNGTGVDSGMRDLLSLPFLAKKLKDIVISENIEFIQSHFTFANYVNIMAKLIGATHFVQIVNNDLISGYENKFFWGRFQLWLTQFLYPSADMIVFKNKAMQKEVRSLLECPLPQKIIPNFFDIDDIDEKSNSLPDEMVFSFNKNKIYITALGEFNSGNNFDILIKAFEKTSHSVSQAELIIIGTGPELKSLIRLSKRCKIYERVAFVKPDNNIYMYLKRSHVFVYSSSVEGFPDAMIEAMICKLPVISTDSSGGQREIIAPNTNYSQHLEQGVEYATYGVLVPDRNVGALCEAMTRLCLDPTVRYQYAGNSRTRAMDFHKDLILEKYKDIFHYKKENKYDILRNESN